MTVSLAGPDRRCGNECRADYATHIDNYTTKATTKANCASRAFGHFGKVAYDQGEPVKTTHFVLLAALTFVLTSEVAVGQTILQQSSRGVSIAVVRQEIDGKQADAVSIAWQPEDVITIPLPSFVEKYVQAFSWAASKVGVIGESANGGSRVLVVERGTSSVIDSFYARAPAASDSGRLIAFTQHSPRYFSRGSLLLVYDLAESPESNRMGVYADLDPMYEAGIAVAPAWNATNQSYGQSPNAIDYFEIPGPLAWWQDSWLFFLSYKSGKVFAVALDVASRSTRQIEIDPLMFVDTTDLQAGIELGALVRAENIEPLNVGPTRAEVRFKLNGRGRVRTVVFEW